MKPIYCGQREIRTPEGDCQQIYSLPVLTTYLSTRVAVCTGLEPVTSCVVGDARFELARGVLNIHLILLHMYRLSIIRQSPIDFY